MQPAMQSNLRPKYKDHEIFMHRGEWAIKCYKTGWESHNAVYVGNRVCLYCGKLQVLENESEPIESPREIEVPRERTRIFCDICNPAVEMQEVSNDSGRKIYYCKNGHKKEIVNLVEIAKRAQPEAKVEKRKRAIQIKCPYCAKVAEVVDESRVFGKLRRKYSCGHTEILPLLTPPLGRDNRWNDLYPFQRDGVEFVEKANYAAQIGDEMGLGKTIQALAVQRYNYDELTPTIMICEAAKVYDWQNEFKSWVGDKYNAIEDRPIIHRSGKLPLCHGFRNHIISMSLLQKPAVLQSILDYGFKYMIVDESHSFKNEDADRTAALQSIAKVVPYKVFLSGTPIMNKVDEYFVPLNILRPSHFPSKAYLMERCDRASNGRVLGISEWYRPTFFHRISEYVLRRTKKDAGIKLPNFRLNKHEVSIDSDSTFVKGYNKLVDELEAVLNKMKQDAGMSSELLGLLARLRHFTGAAKIKPVIQMVNEFLESSDPEDKIAIGVHHKDVMDFMRKGLAEYNPICLSDESPEVKMRGIENFKLPENRVAILSILGMGQGMNIQFCKNAIIAEREWNPAKEDQFCGRFHRPLKNEDGSLKVEFDEASEAVTVDLLNAKDTIDEFFDNLLSLKTHVVGATLDESAIYSPEFLRDLCEKIVSSRLKVAGF